MTRYILHVLVALSALAVALTGIGIAPHLPIPLLQSAAAVGGIFGGFIVWSVAGSYIDYRFRQKNGS